MDVRTICLGILTRADATGYEIKKIFEEGGYRYFVEASFGSIYPALGRLTEEGLVSVREETQAKRPDRKVYSITDEGRRAFLASLQDPLPEDRYRSTFLFAMLFADLMPQSRVVEMIDSHIAHAEANLSQLNQDRQPPINKGDEFVRDFGRTMFAAMLQYLRRRRSEFSTDTAEAAE